MAILVVLAVEPRVRASKDPMESCIVPIVTKSCSANGLGNKLVYILSMQTSVQYLCRLCYM